MTMIEIIAMIATGVLCVLCIICIVALSSSRSQAKENKRAIKDIRDSLGTFSDSINEKTDQLIERLEKQSDDMNTRRLEALEEEVRHLSEVGKDVSVADTAESPAEVEVFDDIEELSDEIELDDLFRELNSMEEPAPKTEAKAVIQKEFDPIPLPDPIPAARPELKPVPAEKPEPKPIQTSKPIPAVQPEPQEEKPRKATRHHQGYNIGRSGRKYTAEELNVLIRE